MLETVQSQAATVDAYLAELPGDRRATLSAIRALIKRHAPPALEETMRYGMPVYTLDGEMLVAFAAQKNYFALYGCGGEFDKYRTELGKLKLNCGKGCLRFRNEKELPLALAERILVARLKPRENVRPGASR